MRLLRNLRLAAILLLSAMAVHGAHFALDLADAFHKTPVEESAIAVSTLEVCPHHAQGCPKSCLCPKTRVQREGSEPDPATAVASSLQEPSWVTCNETGAVSGPPFFGFFLGAAPLHIAPFVLSPLPLPLEAIALPFVFGEPPFKVPIASALRS